MLSRGPATVLLDVDGTLIDNSYFHAIAWWRACRDCGITVPMARLHRLVGMGADQFIDYLFQRSWPELAEAHSHHIAPFFDEMVAFDGASALLRRLAGEGVRLVLATSSRPDEVDQLRRILGADETVDDVTTLHDAGASKPAPDLFTAALKKTGADPGRALAVGDTGWDIAAAHKAGVACVAVESGGWSRQELVEADALEVYDGVGQLLREFDRTPLARLARTGRLDV
jgi:HAD superfamily hydrolase (TIGR01509 family)